MAQSEFKIHICIFLTDTNLNFRCTDRPNFPLEQLSNHQSTQSLAVNLVQHIRWVWSQRCLNHTHTPQIQHLYNPHPVCAVTYRGSLSRLLHTSLWCMACCSRSPLHLRTELVPSGPKQPGKFHCESAKVRAAHSGSTAIAVSLVTTWLIVPLHNSDLCNKRLISVKPQNSLAGWLAWV